MQATPKLSRDEFITRMRQKMEATLGQVADAINEAAPGQIIAGSEERVRDLFADLRQHAYQTGVQMRLDAAEAAFPPPKDPSTGRKKRNKGRQDFTVLTINGRVRLWRRRWHSPGEWTTAPLDAWLDTVEGTISLGAREMACRLSGETLRVLVETEGRRVAESQRSERLPVGWTATDCRVDPKATTTRLYLG